eukprot:m.39290 g.39290  ORF g.39290 m.39290 type:complete len:918 (+) comp9530_c0_seq1:62-2815(+)
MSTSGSGPTTPLLPEPKPEPSPPSVTFPRDWVYTRNVHAYPILYWVFTGLVFCALTLSLRKFEQNDGTIQEPEEGLFNNQGPIAKLATNRCEQFPNQTLGSIARYNNINLITRGINLSLAVEFFWKVSEIVVEMNDFDDVVMYNASVIQAWDNYSAFKADTNPERTLTQFVKNNSNDYIFFRCVCEGTQNETNCFDGNSNKCHPVVQLARMLIVTRGPCHMTDTKNVIESEKFEENLENMEDKFKDVATSLSIPPFTILIETYSQIYRQIARTNLVSKNAAQFVVIGVLCFILGLIFSYLRPKIDETPKTATLRWDLWAWQLVTACVPTIAFFYWGGLSYSKLLIGIVLFICLYIVSCNWNLDILAHCENCDTELVSARLASTLAATVKGLIVYVISLLGDPNIKDVPAANNWVQGLMIVFALMFIFLAWNAFYLKCWDMKKEETLDMKDGEPIPKTFKISRTKCITITWVAVTIIAAVVLFCSCVSFPNNTEIPPSDYQHAIQKESYQNGFFISENKPKDNRNTCLNLTTKYQTAMEKSIVVITERNLAMEFDSWFQNFVTFMKKANSSCILGQTGTVEPSCIKTYIKPWWKSSHQYQHHVCLNAEGTCVVYHEISFVFTVYKGIPGFLHATGEIQYILNMTQSQLQVFSANLAQDTLVYDLEEQKSKGVFSLITYLIIFGFNIFGFIFFLFVWNYSHYDDKKGKSRDFCKRLLQCLISICLALLNVYITERLQSKLHCNHGVFTTFAPAIAHVFAISSPGLILLEETFFSMRYEKQGPWQNTLHIFTSIWYKAIFASVAGCISLSGFIIFDSIVNRETLNFKHKQMSTSFYTSLASVMIAPLITICLAGPLCVWALFHILNLYEDKDLIKKKIMDLIKKKMDLIKEVFKKRPILSCVLILGLLGWIIAMTLLKPQ